MLCRKNEKQLSMMQKQFFERHEQTCERPFDPGRRSAVVELEIFVVDLIHFYRFEIKVYV